MSCTGILTQWEEGLPVVLVAPLPRTERYRWRWRGYIGLEKPHALYGFSAKDVMDIVEGCYPTMAADFIPVDPLDGCRPFGRWWLGFDFPAHWTRSAVEDEMCANAEVLAGWEC